MTLLSKLFGDPSAREVKRALRQKAKETERKYKPLGTIGLAIIKASHACSEGIKSELTFANDRERQQQEIFIFYEFIYFYMHLTMRSAFAELAQNQIKRLQEFLGPLLASTAIDSFFAHWPEELKEKMRSEFLEKLNEAEVEYSTCTELYSKALNTNGLFEKLAFNVAELSGNERDIAAIMSALQLSFDEWKKMNLKALIEAAKTVL